MLKASPPSSDLTPLAEAFALLAQIGRKQREAKDESYMEPEVNHDSEIKNLEILEFKEIKNGIPKAESR